MKNKEGLDRNGQDGNKGEKLDNQQRSISPEKLRWQAQEKVSFIKKAVQKINTLFETLEESIAESRQSVRGIIENVDNILSNAPEEIKNWTPRREAIGKTGELFTRNRRKSVKLAGKYTQGILQSYDLDHPKKMQALRGIQNKLEEKIKKSYQKENEFLSRLQKAIYNYLMEQIRSIYTEEREPARVRPSLQRLPEEEPWEFTEQQKPHVEA